MLPYIVALIVRVATAMGLEPEPAEAIAERAGAECEYGCVVGIDGWVYEVTRKDLEWMARMANCEVADSIGTDDAEATMWAIVQNFYRRHVVGWRESLASFVQAYSACTSQKWATGGSRYSPRVTPIADWNRSLRWNEIPQRVRDFVRSFLRAEIPNRWPGFVIVWTHGWEDHALPSRIGPFYADTHAEGSYNAYYKDRATVDWTALNVRIVSSKSLPEQDGGADCGGEGE